MSTLKVEKIQHPNSASVALTLDTSGYLALQAGSASTPAIQGPSDPNTGIFFPAADTIAFAEGGTEVLRIDSSGRVGIGTSSVSNTLDIRATGANVGVRSTTSGQNQYIFFSNTADSTNGLILQTGSELRLQQQDNVSGSRITFYTKDSERVRITDTGLLGVGTTTPLLAGARNGITLRANSSNGVELLLQSTSATDGTFVGYAIAAVANDVYYVNRLDGFHSWITGSTGATERMRLDASGRLLVGTSSAPTNGELLRVSKASTGTEGAGIHLFGEYSLADDASQTITLPHAALIMVTDQTTGRAGLLFATYNSATITIVSDPSGIIATSDTDTKLCVFKSANTNDVTVKNRLGATRNIGIGKITIL